MKLMKLMLGLLATSLALSSCGMTPNIRPPANPPLAATMIDEKAIAIAFESFDAALIAIDGAIAAGVIEPGTPRANRIADLVEVTRTSLNAAASLQKAGNTADLAVQFAAAKAALAQIRRLIAPEDFR
jgi:hypothetical protein